MWRGVRLASAPFYLMKSRTCFLPLLVFLLATGWLRAASDPSTAWRAADDARVEAMISADPAKLAAVFSDDLLYAHSSGKTDTKATFTEALTSGRAKYNSITYEQRDFREIAPGAVLMAGRGRFVLGKTEPFNEFRLSFLAVYRLEQGKWRFVAWQSCKIP